MMNFKTLTFSMLTALLVSFTSCYKENNDTIIKPVQPNEAYLQQQIEAYLTAQEPYWKVFTPQEKSVKVYTKDLLDPIFLYEKLTLQYVGTKEDLVLYYTSPTGYRIRLERFLYEKKQPYTFAILEIETSVPLQVKKIVFVLNNI